MKSGFDWSTLVKSESSARRVAMICLGVGGCGGGPSVVDVLISDNPTMVLEKVFTVTLSEPAALAIRCTRDDLPEEVHLVESTTSASEHVLRVQGLVAETDYSCVVAPVGATRAVPTEGGFRTDALPASVPAATGITTKTPGAAYTLMPHQRLSAGSLDILLVLMDNDGAVRWYYPIPTEGYADMGADYWGEGLILWGGISASAPGEGAPRLVSISHEEVYRADYSGASAYEYHHIAERQPDNTVVTLVEEEDFQIHQLDVETDTLVWSWQVADHTDEIAPRADANWAGVMTGDDGTETMVVSLCEDYMVFGIDMDSGDVAWTLGEEGSLTLTEGDYPSCQHGLGIDGSRILLYDNGAAPTSRAVEYEIDAAAGTATETWSWTEDGWREWGWGDVDYLGDDRIVITKGHLAAWGDGEGPSSVIEVDRTDNTVAWRLDFSEESDAIYSADRIDGCELFSETSRCPALADRLAELSETFGSE